MKQTMSITVRGRTKQWCFDFKADPQYLKEWTDDGLQIDVIEGSVPMWAVNLGLTKPWFAVQDLWRWLRLW